MALEVADDVDAVATKVHKKKSKKHRREEAQTGGRYVTCFCMSFEELSEVYATDNMAEAVPKEKKKRRVDANAEAEGAPGTQSICTGCSLLTVRLEEPAPSSEKKERKRKRNGEAGEGKKEKKKRKQETESLAEPAFSTSEAGMFFQL